jgi:hypothetical protein
VFEENALEEIAREQVKEVVRAQATSTLAQQKVDLAQ